MEDLAARGAVSAVDYESLAGMPSGRGCSVDLLVDGPQAYEAMLSAIGAACTCILLETYIFSDDHIGRRFAEALADACARGVTVYLMFDSFGSVDSSNDFFGDLADAGIRVVEFNRMSWLKALAEPRRLNHRDHRKLLVIDGCIAFVGGINLSRTYTRSSFRRRRRQRQRLEKAWRDTHVCIEGPIVLAFHEAFVRHWRAATDLPEPGSPDAKANETGGDTVFLLDSPGDHRRRSPIRVAYEEAVRKAEHRVWITQAYCVPDRQLIGCLREATERGADVRLIAAGPTDSFLARYSSNAWYTEMLAAGVRVYEFRASVLHAKTAVIDGYWSTVGSSNLDPRSTWHNDEINAVVLSESFAARLEDLFEQDLGSAREIRPDAWRQRGAGARVLEQACSLLAPWI